MSDGADWQSRRREAAAALAAAASRAAAADSARARDMLVEFVAEAGRRGLAPTRLRARGHSGSRSYRTGVTGWYLNRQATLAVDAEANWYVLNVPGGLLAGLTGVTLEPSDPPLAVGVGARDGESMSLAELLQRRLAAGDDWAR
ncbi:MAG: hypothetical protein U0Q15_15505 [Kineosporiaceae bacterium]